MINTMCPKKTTYRKFELSKWQSFVNKTTSNFLSRMLCFHNQAVLKIKKSANECFSGLFSIHFHPWETECDIPFSRINFGNGKMLANWENVENDKNGFHLHGKLHKKSRNRRK